MYDNDSPKSSHGGIADIAQMRENFKQLRCDEAGQIEPAVPEACMTWLYTPDPDESDNWWIYRLRNAANTAWLDLYKIDPDTGSIQILLPVLAVNTGDIVDHAVSCTAQVSTITETVLSNTTEVIIATLAVPIKTVNDVILLWASALITQQGIVTGEKTNYATHIKFRLRRGDLGGTELDLKRSYGNGVDATPLCGIDQPNTTVSQVYKLTAQCNATPSAQSAKINEKRIIILGRSK
jgi:hypothetical protein